MSEKYPRFKDYLERRQKILDAENKTEEPASPELFNEKTFYPTFVKELLEAEKEVIIYSPYISKFRSEFFNSTLKKLKKRNIAVFIFTRPIEEHEYFMRSEIKIALNDYKEMGANIFYLKGSIHEKLAIIDRKILWEGSLNILSQRSSRELMRRISNEDSAKQMMSYLGINKALVGNYKVKYEELCQELAYDSKPNYILKAITELFRIFVSSIRWWLFAALRVIILSLKGIQLIMSAIKYIF